MRPPNKRSYASLPSPPKSFLFWQRGIGAAFEITESNKRHHQYEPSATSESLGAGGRVGSALDQVNKVTACGGGCYCLYVGLPLWVGWGNLRGHPPQLRSLCKKKATCRSPRGNGRTVKAFFPRTSFRNRGRTSRSRSCQSGREPRGSVHTQATCVLGSFRLIRASSNLPSPSLCHLSSRRRGERGGPKAVAPGWRGPRSLGSSAFGAIAPRSPT